jgi:hypothetical protein
MNTDLKQCEQLARHLPLKERSVLLANLISSLDDFSESECENLWLEEAKRRYKEYKAGNITGRPAKDVLREAHAKLREAR